MAPIGRLPLTGAGVAPVVVDNSGFAPAVAAVAAGSTSPGPPAMSEERRLDQLRRRVKPWNRWGPYLADRAWGTVREDYSGGPTPWEYFPHDHARSRAYRWNEDGLLGLCLPA